MLEEAEKRDHRKLGREMDLFHFQEEGPGVCSGTPRAGDVPESCPTCAGVFGKDL
jgi:threonyl-tRNA synthetase